MKFSILVFLNSISLVLIGQHQFEHPLIWNADDKENISSITDIEKDGDGFIWIGTRNGLFKYDGYTAKRFRNDPSDSLSLSHNEISDIYFHQPKNELWVSTHKDGVNIIDLKTGKRLYNFGDYDLQDLEHDHIYWSFVDREGKAWFSERMKGVASVDIINNTFEYYPYQVENLDIDDVDLERCNSFLSYQEDISNDSIIWFGTVSGILKFNKYTKEYQRYVYNFLNPKIPFSSANSIRCIYQAETKQIYLGTWGGGLLVFDPGTESFENLPLKGEYKKDDKILRVDDIIKKSSNELWITTGEGLTVFNIETKSSIKQYKNDVDENKIYGVRYIDEQNMFWTWGINSSLFSYQPLLQQINNYWYPNENTIDFITTKILDYPYSDQIMLTGQYSEGLYLLDLDKETWSIIPVFDNKNTRNYIYGFDLIFTSQKDVLVIENENIYQLSEDKRMLINYPLDINAHIPQYRCVVEDKDQNLWIGTDQMGLLRLNPANQNIHIYTDELENPTIGKRYQDIDYIAIDGQNRLWTKARGNTYNIYLPEKDTFYLFNYSYKIGRTGHIDFIENDGLGNIWIGIHDIGIGITDVSNPEKGIAKYYLVKDSCSITKPSAMTIDSSGYVWIGGKEGLERINPKTFEVNRFSKYYGLTQRLTSLNTLQNGKIAVGYQGGLGIFHPDSLRVNTEIPTPYLTSFKVFDEELETDSLLSYVTDVYLEAEQNFFSIEFASLGFTLNEFNQYQYKLDGVDQDWINPKERRNAFYTNVKSGSYVFLLKVANNEGVWNEIPLQLNIHIATLWYLSWWAYCIYFLIAYSILFAIYRYRMKRRELKWQLEMEFKETHRLKEVNDYKSKLYTNITHEFRTPLTVIEGMTEQIKGNQNEKKLILRNTNRLLLLVNQMLELAKLENNSLKINLIQDNIIPFLSYLVSSFTSFAHQKEIMLSFFSYSGEVNMDYDSEKIERIIVNLLHNALKFTDQHGDVKVSANTLYKDGLEWLEITIEDTGRGIAEQELPHIFDRFYQVDNSSTRENEGTGIGLTLTKELTELLGGDIEVKSQIGEGTIFKLQFPITQEANKPIAPPEPRIISKSTMLDEVASAQLISTTSSDQPLILLVEDNRDVIYFLKSILVKDYQLIIAGDGEQGILMAIKYIPDLIVSDVMMPNKDGFELCTSLKQDERTSHIPIILLTAKAAHKDRIAGLTTGADAYLSKPFSKKELWIRIEKLIENRRLLQAHFLKKTTYLSKVQELSPEVTKEALFLEKFNTLLEEQMGNTALDIPQLCQSMTMSKTQLYRKVKALTGKSVAIYVRSVRLNKAKQLLKETDWQIGQIAEEVGIADVSYFTRVFKQEFGELPSKMRQ